MISSVCTRCHKNIPCVCEFLEVFETQTKICILQHPQEPGHPLNSAWMTHLCLLDSIFLIGLSWPNLSQVLGKKTHPSSWGVLYLGGQIRDNEVPDVNKRPCLKEMKSSGVLKDVTENLEGIVILDGTWSQAKTLWWRNPWLLKLKRLILFPQKRSLYQGYRKPPRKECLSTLEATTLSLTCLGEKKEIQEKIEKIFENFLKKQKKYS